MSMKKLLTLLLIAFILFGCSTTNNTNTDNEEKSDNLVVESLQLDYALGSLELKQQIKEKYIYYPTDLLINLEENYIRWVADCGQGIDFDIYTDDDQEVYLKIQSIYKGELTEIDENVYSCKGEFMPTMLTNNPTISEDVDFYLVLEGIEAFLIFEETNVKELRFYTSNYSYKLTSFEKLSNHD